jgi:hypothetical protein
MMMGSIKKERPDENIAGLSFIVQGMFQIGLISILISCGARSSPPKYGYCCKPLALVDVKPLGSVTVTPFAVIR